MPSSMVMALMPPTGILHPTEGAEVGVTAAGTDAITYDEVIKLYFSLDKHYRKNAIWIETALHLRTLKDSSGNYLWNHSDNTHPRKTGGVFQLYARHREWQ